MGDPRIGRIAARQAAQTAATHLTVTPLMADTAAMSDEQVGKLTALFDGFDAEKRVYKVGEVVGFGGVLYRAVQAHTSQADWTPDKVPALWAPVRKVAGAAPDEWVQPAGASDAYSKGDRVTFQGQVWESTIDTNVWSPTAHPAGGLALLHTAPSTPQRCLPLGSRHTPLRDVDMLMSTRDALFQSKWVGV